MSDPQCEGRTIFILQRALNSALGWLFFALLFCLFAMWIAGWDDYIHDRSGELILIVFLLPFALINVTYVAASVLLNGRVDRERLYWLYMAAAPFAGMLIASTAPRAKTLSDVVIVGTFIPIVCSMVFGVFLTVRQIGGAIFRWLTGSEPVDEFTTTVAITYAARGREYQAKGDYDRAIADFTDAIRLDPKNSMAYFGRGDSYEGNGDYDRAIADLDEAIRLDPKNFRAYLIRGYIYRYRKEDYDRAITDLNAAIALDPKSGDALFQRGRAYELKKDFAKALADFRSAAVLAPDKKYAAEAVRRMECKLTAK